MSTSRTETSNTELEHHIVPFLGSLAQSVGLLGPSAGVGLVVAGVVGVVGPQAWVTWLIGTIAIAFVAATIVFLSRRFSGSGGLYPLAARVGGGTAGYWVAFGALLWLIVAAPAVILQTGIFFQAFLSLPGIGLAPNRWVLLVICLVTLLSAGWLSARGVKLSTQAMLGIEGTTIILLTILMIITLFHHTGGVIDSSAFNFRGVSVGSIVLGITLVTFAFGGFESATIFGEEAADEKRTIPLAVVGSVALAGLFFMFTTYVMVLGYSGTPYNLATNSDGIGTLALIDGLRPYAYLITLALTAAVVAVNIALYNAGARILYTLGRERVLPGGLGRLNPRTHTPLNGILVFGVANLVGVLAVVVFNFNPITAFDDLGTVSGYGTIVMYAVTCLAVVYIVARGGLAKSKSFLLVPLVGAAVMAYGLYTDFVPFPAFPGSLLVYTFVALVVIAAAVYVVLRVRAPLTLEAVGSSISRLESDAEVGATPS